LNYSLWIIDSVFISVTIVSLQQSSRNEMSHLQPLQSSTSQSEPDNINQDTGHQLILSLSLTRRDGIKLIYIVDHHIGKTTEATQQEEGGKWRREVLHIPV